MTDTVLVVNVGSSSVKLSVLDGDDAVVLSQNLPADASDDALERFFTAAGVPDAIGHRVVHGGPDLEWAVPIGPVILDLLDDAARLAPLHDPPAIAMIRRLRELHPEVPAVACFDTTFHRSIPREHRTYAIPQAWRDAGVRRYGFHGLSYAYANRRAAEMLCVEADLPGDLRVVVCHLGAGASVCGIEGGRSVDTTMGFTPVEGLVMATRSGDVDPGALMWLQKQLDLSADEMDHALNHESGLLGLTGTADMAELIEWRSATHIPDRMRRNDASQVAFDVYVARVAKAVASMVVSIGRLDALVFTGGVGENSALTRASVAAKLAFLGVQLGPDNDEADVDHNGDLDIGHPAARVRTLVIKAREDLEIARQVRDALLPPETPPDER